MVSFNGSDTQNIGKGEESINGHQRLLTGGPIQARDGDMSHRPGVIVVSVPSCICRGSSRGVDGAVRFTGVSTALSYASSFRSNWDSCGPGVCSDSSAVAYDMKELARDAARAGNELSVGVVAQAPLNADGGTCDDATAGGLANPVSLDGDGDDTGLDERDVTGDEIIGTGSGEDDVTRGMLSTAGGGRETGVGATSAVLVCVDGGEDTCVIALSG